MQTMKLLNSIPKTNIFPATLSVLNFKAMYSTYCLRMDGVEKILENVNVAAELEIIRYAV